MYIHEPNLSLKQLLDSFHLQMHVLYAGIKNYLCYEMLHRIVLSILSKIKSKINRKSSNEGFKIL